MTDNEIIKALDCFSGKEIYCKNCAYRDNSNMGICRRNAAKDTIDLIYRQKAEIERLKCDNSNIHRLFSDACKRVDELDKLNETVKAEAIKDFVKKFKKEIKDVGFTLGQFWEINCALESVLKKMGVN